MTDPRPPRIVVFGSLNADLSVQLPELPQAGQTVLGSGLFRSPGGKGANQAVAAAHATQRRGLPAAVRMVGRVGADDEGQLLRESLAAAGVDDSGVQIDREAPTGVALILVDDAGDNMIAVAPGANLTVGEADVAGAVAGLRPGDVVVCQLEVPVPAIRQLVRSARAVGARTVCNAAPAAALDPELLASLTVLVVNETEARHSLGLSVTTPPQAAQAAASAGCAVVVTLGSRGAVYATPDGDAGACPAPSVEAVDTVGAGDAFVGAFAVALTAGDGVAEAVTAGVAAGATAVTQLGARYYPHPPDPKSGDER
ncbi:ribokinase [Natronosporangium hydrolyticum]|uniref:Ribokinase n=1 Tax=Natronosporangium hydrolyticum TaxID=2811111 RepID=A0A895YRX2_9ACTN|nr:ribokinase [Natronosporangium hydrolyticum]QSB16768.1 ribokinase [Natronosporangium hydrolyticum]